MSDTMLDGQPRITLPVGREQHPRPNPTNDDGKDRKNVLKDRKDVLGDVNEFSSELQRPTALKGLCEYISTAT